MFKSTEELYANSLAWCLRHKKIILSGFSLMFAASLFLVPFIGNEFSPEEDSGDLRISIELPMGTRVEETDKVASVIEDIFQKEVPEAMYAYVRSGNVSGIGRSLGQSAGTHIVACGIKLVSKTKRNRSVNEVAQGLRKRINNLPGVVKTNVTTGNPIGRLISGMGGKAVQVEIIGNSFEDTDKFALEVKNMMGKVQGAVDVSISRELKRPELKIQVDRQKAANLGLNMQTIASTLKSYIEGSTATKYREKGETYDIYVRLEESSRSKIEDIENLYVVSPFTKKQIKFANFASIEESKGPVSITRQNRERVVKVECNTYGRSTGKVVEDIKKELKNLAMPSDIMVNFGGDAEEQQKAFKDLALLLIIGVILVYMVMAAQFESLLDPFIVMFSVPFTFTGVLVAFFITNTTLSIISFLGMVMLMGIVVNNAIVLISYINILRARGLKIKDAITQSGKERLRPVLMTTITTLAGLLPLALSRGEGSETWNPLGITMIGGLTVSTFITMLFVPTLYAVFEAKLKNKGIAA